MLDSLKEPVYIESNGISDVQIERRILKKRKRNLKVDNILQIKRFFGPELLEKR